MKSDEFLAIECYDFILNIKHRLRLGNIITNEILDISICINRIKILSFTKGYVLCLPARIDLN